MYIYIYFATSGDEDDPLVLYVLMRKRFIICRNLCVTHVNQATKGGERENKTKTRTPDQPH